MTSRRLRAVCGVLLIAAFAAACEKSHEEKAKEWIDLGEFEAARYELSLAIQKNPKGVEARVLLATTFIKQSRAMGDRSAHLIGNALAVLAEVDRIEGRQNKSTQVRSQAHEQLAAVVRSGAGASAVDVIRQYPSPLASSVLEYAMAERQEAAAIAAEEVLRRIDADKAKKRLIELLAVSEATVRERAAERLWERDRYEQARPILRAKLLRELPRMDNQALATGTVQRLIQMGYDEVSETLVELVRKALTGDGKMQAALATFDALVERRDPRAAEVARGVIAFKSAKHAASAACSPTTRVFVRALGTLKSKASFDALREALSYVMVHSDSRFGGCLEAYFDALAQNDGAAWRGIKFWYDRGGWPIFLTMIPGRIESARRGEESSTYGAQGWQLFGKDATSARERLTIVLQRLGRYSVFSGGRQIWYSPQKLMFEHPAKVAFLIHLHDMGRSNEIMPNAAGRLTLILESLGLNPEQPWVITAVQDGYLDGANLF
jgi:tetratricopeptide (TPR) repeat protein